MHELGALAARARGVVIFVYQRDLEASERGVACNTSARDTSPDHEEIEALGAQALQAGRPRCAGGWFHHPATLIRPSMEVNLCLGLMMCPRALGG